MNVLVCISRWQVHIMLSGKLEFILAWNTFLILWNNLAFRYKSRMVNLFLFSERGFIFCICILKLMKIIRFQNSKKCHFTSSTLFLTVYCIKMNRIIHVFHKKGIFIKFHEIKFSEQLKINIFSLSINNEKLSFTFFRGMIWIKWQKSLWIYLVCE